MPQVGWTRADRAVGCSTAGSRVGSRTSAVALPGRPHDTSGSRPDGRRSISNVSGGGAFPPAGTSGPGSGRAASRRRHSVVVDASGQLDALRPAGDLVPQVGTSSTGRSSSAARGRRRRTRPPVAGRTRRLLVGIGGNRRARARRRGAPARGRIQYDEMASSRRRADRPGRRRALRPRALDRACIRSSRPAVQDSSTWPDDSTTRPGSRPPRPHRAHAMSSCPSARRRPAGPSRRPPRPRRHQPRRTRRTSYLPRTGRAPAGRRPAAPPPGRQVAWSSTGTAAPPALLEHRGKAPQVAGDHRGARGHRLRQHDPEALSAGLRGDIEVDRPEALPGRVVDRPRKRDSVGQPRRLVGIAAAGHQQPAPGDGGPDPVPARRAEWRAPCAARRYGRGTRPRVPAAANRLAARPTRRRRRRVRSGSRPARHRDAAPESRARRPTPRSGRDLLGAGRRTTDARRHRPRPDVRGVEGRDDRPFAAQARARETLGASGSWMCTTSKSPSRSHRRGPGGRHAARTRAGRPSRCRGPPPPCRPSSTYAGRVSSPLAGGEDPTSWPEPAGPRRGHGRGSALLPGTSREYGHTRPTLIGPTSRADVARPGRR